MSATAPFVRVARLRGAVGMMYTEIYLGGKKVTNKQLERGVELKTLKDGLWRKKEHLEKIKVICFENMDIAK